MIGDTKGQTTDIIGDNTFLTEQKIARFISYAADVRRMFKAYLFDEAGVLPEWLFAYNCDSSGKAVGEKYLVFYAARVA